QLFLERNVLLAALRDGVLNGGLVPLRVVAQQVGSQLYWLLYAHATVAKVAGRLRKQLIVGRVVEVDVVGIGENKFHLPQVIFRARPAAQRVLKSSGCHVGPVHGGGVNNGGFAAVAFHHFHVEAVEVVGVRRQLWPQLLVDDAEGYVPIGRQHYILHLVGEHGRRVERLAHDDAHGEGLLATLIHVEAVLRNVDQ
nr:hypothetical protein [Tanacetum cinerariifolium]